MQLKHYWSFKDLLLLYHSRYKYYCPSEKDSHLLGLVYAFSRNHQESHYSSQWLFIFSDWYKTIKEPLTTSHSGSEKSLMDNKAKWVPMFSQKMSLWFIFSRQRSWFDLEKNTLCCSAASTLSLSVYWANCLLKEREWGVAGNNSPILVSLASCPFLSLCPQAHLWPGGKVSCFHCVFLPTFTCMHHFPFRLQGEINHIINTGLLIYLF